MTLNFGNNIKQLRLKRGLSQEKLAERLGVAPQSVSKWERNEGYPDITFLLPLAEFFDVSLDELLGRDKEKKEAKIVDILEKIEECRHNGDHETKNKLIDQAYNEFPYDFRIVDWYIVMLLDVEDVSKNKRKIEELCSYILAECTIESCRYGALSSLIELYGRIGDHDKAIFYADRLPDMNCSREFERCGIYPMGDERNFRQIAAYVNRGIENILWFLSQIAARRDSLDVFERIEILVRAASIGETCYPEGDFCVCHSVMADIHLLLFRFYSQVEKYDEALISLKKAFEHEKAIDDIVNDVVLQSSVIFRGNDFDMRKTYDGCKCNGVWWLFDRLKEGVNTFEYYQGSDEYKAVLDRFNPFAVEDKT